MSAACACLAAGRTTPVGVRRISPQEANRALKGAIKAAVTMPTSQATPEAIEEVRRILYPHLDRP